MYCNKKKENNMKMNDFEKRVLFSFFSSSIQDTYIQIIHVRPLYVDRKHFYSIQLTKLNGT